jgi:hypothetical protein
LLVSLVLLTCVLVFTDWTRFSKGYQLDWARFDVDGIRLGVTPATVQGCRPWTRTSATIWDTPEFREVGFDHGEVNRVIGYQLSSGARVLVREGGLAQTVADLFGATGEHSDSGGVRDEYRKGTMELEFYAPFGAVSAPLRIERVRLCRVK